MGSTKAVLEEVYRYRSTTPGGSGSEPSVMLLLALLRRVVFLDVRRADEKSNEFVVEDKVTGDGVTVFTDCFLFDEDREDRVARRLVVVAVEINNDVAVVLFVLFGFFARVVEILSSELDRRRLRLLDRSVSSLSNRDDFRLLLLLLSE